MAKTKKAQMAATDEQSKQDGGNTAAAVDSKAHDEAKKPLSAAEKKQLNACETAINAYLGCFYAVGSSLRMIDNQRLYRGKEYSNFDVYCAERWSMSGSHARRLIDAADIVDTLRKEFSPKGEGEELLPESEGQVRPLSRLKNKPEQQVEAWRQALEKSKTEKKRITGQMVDAIVDEILGEKAKPTPQSKGAVNADSHEEDDGTAAEVLAKIAKAKAQLDKGKTQKVAEYLKQIEDLIRQHFGLSD